MRNAVQGSADHFQPITFPPRWGVVPATVPHFARCADDGLGQMLVVFLGSNHWGSDLCMGMLQTPHTSFAPGFAQAFWVHCGQVNLLLLSLAFGFAGAPSPMRPASPDGACQSNFHPTSSKARQAFSKGPFGLM